MAEDSGLRRQQVCQTTPVAFHALAVLDENLVLLIREAMAPIGFSSAEPLSFSLEGEASLRGARRNLPRGDRGRVFADRACPPSSSYFCCSIS
eukprot:s902_g22.t1